jgi:serine/threonine protein phosphatase PrpC
MRARGEQRDMAIREAFRQTNEKLESGSKIDCMMSGTTVVVTMMYKNMVICANSGDSRAVMFSLKEKEWGAQALSRDHKPEDPEEASRIRASNGRVE